MTKTLFIDSSLLQHSGRRWKQGDLIIHEVESEATFAPQVLKVLELTFIQDNSPFYPFCYALPLLPGKRLEHIEYCRQAMHEKKEQTTKACLAFGMRCLHKWIQEVEGQDFVLYYQEMQAPIEQCRSQFLALKDNEKALQATNTLRKQTGLTFEEFCPRVEQV